MHADVALPASDVQVEGNVFGDAMRVALAPSLLVVTFAASCSRETSNPPPDVVIEPSPDVVEASALTDAVLRDTIDMGGAQPCTAGRIEECP